MLDLERVKRLCDAATPGPWFTHTRQASGEAEIWSVEFPEGYDDLIAGSFKRNAHPEGIANAFFIAEARTALPELIAEVERLNAAFAVQLDRLHKGGLDEMALRLDMDNQAAEVKRLRGALEATEWYTDPDDPERYRCLICLATHTNDIVPHHDEGCIVGAALAPDQEETNE